MENKLLTTQQAAEYLGGFRTNTLEGWRIKGTGPRYRKINRLVRYSVADLDAFLDSAARSSTSQNVVRAV